MRSSTRTACSLFDTGIGFGDDEHRGRVPPHRPRTCPTCCGTVGIDPDDVTAIAYSHLHFDHCGQNAAFPGRPIHVQAAELRRPPHGPDYTIPDWVDFPGAAVRTATTATSSSLPGVRLVADARAHARPPVARWSTTVHGRTPIVGQALYTRAEWDGSDDRR